MTEGASERILAQLRWIKWLTAVVAVSFAAIAGVLIWTSFEMSSMMEETSSFADRASRLLDQGKEAEVLKLADELEKKAPKDPNAFWYRGRAQYQLGQYPEAMKSMQRVEELAPTWRAEYTGPYMKAIEEKLGPKR